MCSIQLIAAGDVTQNPELSKLRTELNRELRACDIAFLLPGCNASKQSSDLKNIVIGLDAHAENPPVHLFSSNWGHGVSAIRLPTETVEPMLATEERRKQLLNIMANAIPNELSDTRVHVGPKLQSNKHRDSDGDNWLMGFDGENCSCGVYSATELQSITGNRKNGMTRPVRSYFLVVKAGGGLAAQQFHAELSGLCTRGVCLHQLDQDHQLELKMKRVVNAGRRNRAAILAKVANLIGLGTQIDTLVDHAAATDVPAMQLAILLVDAVTNTLAKTERDDSREMEWRYYAGSVSPQYSQSSMLCSNVSEGYVAFLTTRDSSESIQVRNEAGGALPFSSARLCKTSECLERAVHARMTGELHPESEWVTSHFSWHRPTLRRIGHLSKQAQECIHNTEPAVLWGSHEPIEYARWLRSLGADETSSVRLYPAIVVLAGNESSMLRSAAAMVDEQYKQHTHTSVNAKPVQPSPIAPLSFAHSHSINNPRHSHPQPIGSSSHSGSNGTAFAQESISSTDAPCVNAYLTSPSLEETEEYDDSFMKRFGNSSIEDPDS